VTVFPQEGDVAVNYARKLLAWTNRSEKPYATHSVVLVVEDNKRKGTFGLCINRPAPILPCTCGQCPVPPVPLYLGGPKHLDNRYFLLHDQPLAADKRDRVIEKVYVSCPYALKELQGEGKDRGKMITGYFHWLPGELEEEVAMGWWEVNDKPTHEQVLVSEPRHVWGKLVPLTERIYPSAN
jgi:putative AlgH/UPF0301 family transcriptional regulator